MIIKKSSIDHYSLILGISLGLSILFQIYWLGMDGPHIRDGGSVFRFLMKILAISFIYFGLYRSLSVSVFAYNLALKIPLLYYFATVLAVFPYIYNNGYNQAMNLAFFIPFLFINLTDRRGLDTYRFIINVIVCVVTVQVFIDIALKVAGLQQTRTLLGGMGNANTFGLYLIVAGLACRFIYSQENASRLFLLLVPATGSLVCSVIAFMFLLQSIFLKFKLKTILGTFFSLASIGLLIFIFWDLIYQEGNSVWHAHMKFLALMEYVVNGQSGGSASIAIRDEYTKHALFLLSENPFALIFGHPNFLPFYSGDGFYIALLVTIGFPITFIFVVCNIIAIYKGLRERQPLSIFSAYVVLTFLILFVSNRILDYWPSSLIYMLAFSFLTGKKSYKFFAGKGGRV